jgi:hypothetical protein
MALAVILAQAGITATPRVYAANAVDMFNPTYIELSKQVPACTPDNPFGGDCNAAIHRWCQGGGYVSGFGPVEHSGVDAYAVCVDGSAAERYDVAYEPVVDDTVLSYHHSGCTSENAFSDACNAAINRYCQKKKGAVSGFGPVEYRTNDATVVCVFGDVFPATAVSSSERSVDADGVLWGTESAVGIDNFNNLRRNTPGRSSGCQWHIEDELREIPARPEFVVFGRKRRLLVFGLSANARGML